MWYWYIATGILSGMAGFVTCALLTGSGPDYCRTIRLLRLTANALILEADRIEQETEG